MFTGSPDHSNHRTLSVMNTCLTKSEVRRILLIRPSALGDVCRTVPILVSLKNAYPKAEIDWLVQDTFADAISAHPDIHEVIPFPRKYFGRAIRDYRSARDLVRWLKNLRTRKYDLVYDCQGLARSGFFAWSTRAPKRVGFADAREAGHLGYTHRYTINPKLHTVDRMLALLEADDIKTVQDMRLYVSQVDTEWWASIHNLKSAKQYAVLAPTSRWETKRWPEDRFAALLNPLLDSGYQTIYIVGSETEKLQCTSLLDRCDGVHVINLMGATRVGQLLAVIQNANLVIANDSAALHIAVGFYRPYIALFGPTDITQVGPYKGDQWVLQHLNDSETLHHKNTSLGQSIMARISVDDVLNKLHTIQHHSQDCST